MSFARRTVEFPDAIAKAEWLAVAAQRDACCPTVRSASARITAGVTNERLRAERLHRWVRDQIAYATDPDGEQLADSETVLARGYDDCDGKSRLFVALCIAAGLEARIRAVFNERGDFTHVQAQVRWPGSPWVLAELILAGVELGQGIEAARFDAAGNVVLA